RSESRADHTAEAEREKTLDRVEAEAARVAPRIEETDDARALIGVRADEIAHAGEADRDERDEHDQVRARGEVEDRGGARDNGARAEVRLTQDEDDDRQRDRQERQEAGTERRDPLAA